MTKPSLDWAIRPACFRWSVRAPVPLEQKNNHLHRLQKWSPFGVVDATGASNGGIGTTVLLFDSFKRSVRYSQGQAGTASRIGGWIIYPDLRPSWFVRIEIQASRNKQRYIYDQRSLCQINHRSSSIATVLRVAETPVCDGNLP